MNGTREEELFALALEQPTGRRAAFLETVCADDLALRRRIETLLAAHEHPDARLAEPAANFLPTRKVTSAIAASAERPNEMVGQTIGRYKLLEKVGEGGCGLVYVADQTEPVRRRVALKVIKLGMDTASVVARFEAERQALAMMDHPNIAKVFDAGATEQGRPFFVMELVRGIRITDYCDQAQLSTTERLELFMKVCQAIQHAHQKGIIHRDIKPSNILVTLHDGVPVPKVIDFGIAKATEGRLTDATVYTQLHQFMGTPAYMSPEQAEMSGLDIDTRSDIYSLGVLLYELLAGSTPFDGKDLISLGLDQMRRVIREQEPLRPSTRLAMLQGQDLTATASRRSAEAPRLIHLLKGDLDWIVMKCLEKDRNRRYDTANGLAGDLKRHLGNEPIAARPPSAAYRLQKAFRRNRLAFSAGGIVILALIAGLSLAAAGLRQALKERNTALRAREAELTQRRAAEVAQANEAVLRQQAERRELSARRRAYAADLHQVQSAIGLHELGRARLLLDRYKPNPGEPELRGWEWRYLWSQARGSELEVLSADNCQIGRTAFSADGRMLTFSQGDETRVIEVASKQTLLQRTNAICPVFAHRGSTLVFAAKLSPTSSALTLFDVASAKETVLATIPTDKWMWIGLSPDDRRILGVTADFREDRRLPSDIVQLTVWETATGRQLWEHSVTGPVAISPNGASVAGVAASQVVIWGAEDGREQLRIESTNRHFLTLAFSPDSASLLAGTEGHSEVQIWDARSGQIVDFLEGHLRMVDDMSFTPDGRRLITCSRDRTIRVWDWASRRQVSVLHNSLTAEPRAIALSADGRTLTSQTHAGSLLLQDIERPTTYPGYRVLPVPLSHAVFTSGGRTIVTAERDGGLSEWDLPSCRRLRQWSGGQAPVAGGTRIPRTVISPDATKAAALMEDGRIKLLNLVNGAWTNSPAGIVVDDILFTANGKYLLTFQNTPSAKSPLSVWNGAVPRKVKTAALEMQVWDTSSWQNLGTFGVDPTIIDYERELGVFATGLPNSVAIDVGGELQIWDITKLASPLAMLTAPNLPAGWFWFSAATSPDGRWLAAGHAIGSVSIWNLETAQLTRTLGGHTHFLRGLSFSPDGTRLATANMGGKPMKLWELEDGEELLTLPGEGFAFRMAAHSPDGQFLMARNRAGTLHLWSAPAWEEIAAAELKEKAEGHQR